MSAPAAARPVWIGRPEVGSPAWHTARRSTINGSEIAAVMGISPYESAFSLWHRKQEQLGEVEQDAVMYWGNRLEPVVLDEFQLRHPELWVQDGGGLYRHPDRAWQGGSPDGRIWDRKPEDAPWPDGAPSALLECKTAKFADGWGLEGTDEVPVHYRAQLLWYLDVFGLQHGHVAVLIGGSDYREYRITYAADEVAAMREAAQAFLDTIAARQRPAIDAHDATYQAVKEMHPEIDPESVAIPDETARSYLAALCAHKDAEAEKRRASAVLADLMGNAQYAIWNDRTIADRRAKGGTGATPYLQATRGIADTYRKEQNR